MLQEETPAREALKITVMLIKKDRNRKQKGKQRISEERRAWRIVQIHASQLDEVITTNS